ncbi:Pancreatic triacylglycerol lipase [Pseudolycoriella hygida]|uniref:Pancreatic triacylglycerol lipase n=1 Tax=Pseudolycoriella hygida TaxID=35572 RepID=A0A9Q0NBN4_9DIPT|nr:Pancreatic triacylglycerol lipase [Pseudolycoriella hygida]
MKKLLLLAVLKLVKIISSHEPPITGRIFPFNLLNCRITSEVCPNKDITFYLYTRTTQMEPHELNVANPETIKEAKFVTNRPLIVLIHGFTGHKNETPNTEVRPAYFRRGEYNIISVDYQPLAVSPCYVHAVLNLPTVANCTAQLINYLIQESLFTLDNIHIIGASLGAQTAGMMGNFIKSGKLKRITGLDPAKPLFVFAKNSHRLGKNDAEFVDIIHTEVMLRGVLFAIGHVDFYANGGLQQPGCDKQKQKMTGNCNHVMASKFYAESINSEIGFYGYKCSYWLQWFIGLCQPSNQTELAGAFASKEARGSYFFKTNSKPPYAQGK